MAKAQSLTPGNNDIENEVKEGTVAKETPFNRWLLAIRNEAEVTANFTDSGEIAENVMTAMLGAETLDEAIAVQDAGLPSAKDTMLNVEHTVHSFDILPSKKSFDNKTGVDLKVFFRVSATRLDTGQDITYSVGALNPCMILHTARRTNELPGDFIIRGKETDNGTLLLMYRVSKRAVQV